MVRQPDLNYEAVKPAGWWKRYEYVRLHIGSNTRQIDFVHCSSELIFLRLLNKWNRQAAAGIGISGSPSWFYYAQYGE
jgi:hypothetical protein